MNDLSAGYFGEEGMLAYVGDVQRQEIRKGVACVKHQRMAGSDLGDDHLLPVALAALGSAQRPGSGGAIRFTRSTFLYLRPDHSGAGHFLAGRSPNYLRHSAVLRHRTGGSRVVRLFLFPDLVDRSVHDDRTLGAG